MNVFGVVWNKGDNGGAGAPGVVGLPGPAGPAGTTGPTGPTGPTGSAGADGAGGAIGAVGATGPAGPAGPSSGGGIFEQGDLDDLLAVTGMSIGDLFYLNRNLGTNYTAQENKVCVWSGRTWQVPGETIELLATQDMLMGNTVEVDTSATQTSSNNYKIRKTVLQNSSEVIGVVALDAVTAGDWCAVATRGIWEVSGNAETYNRGEYLSTDTKDGQAHRTASVGDQPFAKILESRVLILDGADNAPSLVWALLHSCEQY